MDGVCDTWTARVLSAGAAGPSARGKGERWAGTYIYHELVADFGMTMGDAASSRRRDM